MGQKKKKEKKKKKVHKQPEDKKNQLNPQEEEEEVEIEYIAEPPPLENLVAGTDDPNFDDFIKIIEKFQQSEPEPEPEAIAEETEENEEDKPEEKKMSNKQKKRLKRMEISRLKSLSERPDLVEAWDVTSADPVLLAFMKGYRNTVPVPRHWNQKRKYLQGKRGVEKPPFQLPEFIAATGITRIRAAVQAKDDAKSLKAKQRDRLNPKMGRMDIDYQVLHDAFFRYQTKPKLTTHGDLYYEGKEFEIQLREKKPGRLSEELKRAIGMPEGAPPPWLINMQRYGPPPSYPNLKIPGLNAPIPEGCRYGYHPGGWGKPPVDEFGRPLYGDVFGTTPAPPPEITQPIERKHWGEMEQEEEEEEEEVQQEEEEETEEHASGIETPSGLLTPSGLETPETLELRKGPVSTASQQVPPKKTAPEIKKEEEDESDKQLYQIIEQKEMSVGNALLGSTHSYVMPQKREMKNKENRVDIISKTARGEKLDVSLDPSEVERLEELDSTVFKKKYEKALDEKKQVREDMSDLLAEHEAKQEKKRKRESDSKSRKSRHKF